MKLPLYIPVEYLHLTDEQKDEICNGCGAKDGMKAPDTIWFLSIVIACNIHDYMFYKGKTLGDYYFSNIMFFWNMTAIVINGSNFIMLLPRMERVLKYFLAVMSKFGIEAYWTDKKIKKNDTMSITIKGEFL